MYLCYNIKSLEKRQQRKKKVVGGKEGLSNEFTTPTSTTGDGTRTKEEYELN
jgi:hypothetical protein